MPTATRVAYFKDLNSGARIQNVVVTEPRRTPSNRAGDRPTGTAYTVSARFDRRRVRRERGFRPTPPTPMTGRGSGKKGERIVYIRTSGHRKEFVGQQGY